MRKNTFLVAVTVAGLSLANHAFAGEGNGEPFPFHAAGDTTSATIQTADTGAAFYPQATPSTSLFGYGETILPTNGSEAAVQTANSLPSGFSEGTVAYGQNRSMQAWLAARGERRIASR